ncbi:hypothetical protein BDW68DRAFT_175719 [Aspergillus falconensis]
MLQVRSLISLFVTFSSFHLLNTSETSMIETAKDGLRSAKQVLPVRQRLLLHLFPRIIVGTACMPEELIESWVINPSNVDFPVSNFNHHQLLPPPGTRIMRRIMAGMVNGQFMCFGGPSFQAGSTVTHSAVCNQS